MDQFVCVRVTKISNLDQGLFQFDKNLTFAILFTNADMDVYGRYGTRAGGGFIAANRPERDTRFLATKDISRESLRKAMEKALQFHEVWKKDKRKVSRILAPKVGSSYLDQPLRKPATPRFPRSNGCIHCHQVAEREVGHYWNRRKPVPDQILWGYPMPERLGFACDPDECATVKSVASGGEAERAGLKVGDRIHMVDGQPILSIADIQWTLNQAPKGGNLKLVVYREDARKQLTLELPEGWRRRGQFAWRYSYNELKWKVLGLDQLKEVNNEDRKRLAIQDDKSAIRIGRVIQGESRWYRTYCNLEAWNVGLRNGDIILDIDGQGRLDESQFMAYILQETKPRHNITLTVLRSGTRKKFTYRLNTLR